MRKFLSIIKDGPMDYNCILKGVTEYKKTHNNIIEIASTY